MKLKKRILSVLMILCLVAGLLPLGALPLDVFAADLIDYEISIGGISITSNNIDRFESAENNRYGVAFDKSSNTLYLSAPDAMSVTNVDFISYFGKGTLTVVVLEDIRIECRGDSGFLHAKSGSVVFSAESKGSLSITNGITTAIKADKLTVEGGEILMNLPPASGIYWNTAIEANVISVNGGFLEVYGFRRDDEHGGVSEFHNTGIVYNTVMTVSGGVVAVHDYAYGIVAKDDNAVLNIKGGTVEVDAFRTGVKDGSLCHTAGALFAGGVEHGIYAAGIQVSGTAKLVAYNVGTYTGESYPVYAKGELKVDTNVFFISKPEGGYVKDHPYGGKIIIDPSTNQPAVGMVKIMPRVSCFVSRNDGPEEEYPLTYSPENSGKFDLFQVRVGDNIVVRLVANDGQLLHYKEPNGPQSVAQWYFLTTKRSEDQKELTFTFEPTYLPKAAWTYNDESRMWENSYNKDEATAGCSVTLSPRGNNASAYQFSWLSFEALPGKTVWEEAKAQVTIPRGETLRVRVPLKTYDGRDIAVSKEEFDYKLIKYIIYISQDSHSITHDGDSSVIVELKVADNARLGDGGNTKNEAVWEFFFSNSYEEVRFSLVATVVECWCDMGERLIERPVSEAACTVGGCAVKHWECSKCGKLFADAAGNTPITDPQTVLTPAKGHKWVEKVDAGYLKSAADCENPAVYYKSCEYCGLSSKELYDLRAAAANFVPGSAETVTIDGVEFYILAVDDGKALLLTKDVVASGIAFDTDSPAWEGSDMQKWLNGEWLAGKPRLAALAEPAEIYTAAAYDDQKKTVASRDRVFLLSEADVFGEHNRQAVTNTALYTYNNAKLTAPGKGWGINGAHWWLRSPCSSGLYVSAVTDYGYAHTYPYSETSSYVSPRPAMWVRFDDPDPTPEWQYKIGKIVPGSDDTVTIDGVEFHVLAKDAAKGEALLLTKNVIGDYRKFSSFVFEWRSSDLRTWLNGEWLEGMPVLKNFVNETEILTRGVPDDYRTQDKVFLLSAADVFGGGIEYTYNKAELPAPGGSWVAYDQDGTEADWWLRSLHINNSGSNTDVVDHNANLYSMSPNVPAGVRPAVWVPYKEPEWQYQIGKIKPGSDDTVTIDGVEFHVLAKDAAKGEALLLTKNVLDDNRAFGDTGVEWVLSDLRTWLNDEWLEGMPVLKNFVNETKIITSDHTTLDKVFLLSKGDVFGDGGIEYTYNEAKLPAPGGSWIAYKQDGTKASWWLRSVYINNSDNMCVVERFNADLLPLSSVTRSGVRPAVWVPYKEPEWQEKIESITPGDADTVTIDGVEFHVLAKDAAKGEALLLTKDVLYNKDFDLVFSHRNNPSWADSLLRDFMNGRQAETGGGSRFFYHPNNASTLAQYAQETEIYTPAGYDSTGFVMTRDTFFLLSEADVFGTQNGVAVTDPQYYTYKGKLPAPGGSWIAADGDGKPRYWWLRSPRYNQYSVAQVLDDGTLNSINPNAYDYDRIRGVRPAVWIQYKEPLPEPETFTHGDALGHDWGAASYTWGPGNSTCTAQHTCTREGCEEGEFEIITATCEETIAPTCTKPGQYTYTATFTKAGFGKQTTTSPIDPLGGEHEWLEEGWTWYYPDIGDRIIAEGAFPDYPAVTLKLKCSKCGDGVSVSVPKAELQLLTEGDVCNGGKRSFIATVNYEGVEYSDKNTFETINGQGHDYGAPTYVWSTDKSTCTATRVCLRGCGHKETETANSTGSQTTDPKCGVEGVYTYTAEFANKAFEKQTTTVPVAALAHDFGTPTYVWSTDKSTCTATRVCLRGCGHKETETANSTGSQTTDPKCGVEGVYTYTAEFANKAFEKQTTTVPVAALDHSYGEVTYVWSTDKSTCTATRVCLRDGCGHKETETANSTGSQTTDPKCGVEGVYTYTAQFTNPAFTKQTETVPVAALDHSYGEPTYVWSTDKSTCTAERVCLRGCGHKETETANSTGSQTTDPKCGVEGVYTYTAEFANKAFEKQTTTVPVAALAHDFGTPTYVWSTDKSTCTAERVCLRGCGHKETETANSTGSQTTAPKCGVEGVYTYTAQFTNPAFEKQTATVPVAALEHDWGDWTTVRPSTDRVKGEERRVCKHDESHFQTRELDLISYQILPKPGEDGTPAPGSFTVTPQPPKSGEEVTVTPTPPEGYAAEAVRVTDKDGNEIPAEKDDEGNYRFRMPEGDVTVEIVWKEAIPGTADHGSLLPWIGVLCTLVAGAVLVLRRRFCR